ncbi:hypothetical protein HKX48_008240 [Thoreauomyces humboldtii]|nr:hypothetical protein HKX48_008240 [Thoreauomyces humboldtii]
MSSEPLSIVFRLTPGLESTSGAADVVVQVEDPSTSTLADLKQQLATKLKSIASEQLRLVYGGRIFKDDEAQVDSLGLKNNAVVHATKLATNRAADEAGSPATTVPNPRQPPAGPARNAFGLPDMAGALENPFVRSMLENPDFVRSMLENDPRIARLAESNPQLRQTLSDPRFMREMLETMRNPSLSQEMMRNVDRQLLNIENIPGGFNALSSMYHDMNGPMDQMREENPSTDETNRQFAEMFGAQRRSSDEGTVNNDALPNPWAAPPAQARQASSAPGAAAGAFDPMGAMGGFPGLLPGGGAGADPFAMFNASSTLPGQTPGLDMNTMLQQLQMMQGFSGFPLAQHEPTQVAQPLPAAPTAIANTQAHEERFALQLSALSDMGFQEKDQNIRALLAAGGNVEAAIAYMLDSP